MASIISTKTSGGGGIAVTGDTSGVMQLASNDGTTAVTIDASQNVGIGTASAGQKLEINTTSSASNTATRYRTSSDFYDVGVGGSTSGFQQGNFYIYNGGTATTLLSMTSSGSTVFAAQVQAKHVDASGYAFRAQASAGNNNEIQFVSNAQTEQAYVGSPIWNSIVLRTTYGSASSYDANWVNVNGGSLALVKVTSSNGDIGDWPTPVLSVKKL